MTIAISHGVGLPLHSVAGLTDLQQTMPLVWLLLVISVIGAAVTWAFLAYAIWKYRDPATKGRRYG
jgi:heme/copper-type cytochrome/quinol oxidase subunit 2